MLRKLWIELRTAVSCLDYLSAILSRLAGRALELPLLDATRPKPALNS